MINAQNIRFLFLSMVYVLLLLSVVIPHHHHEETACFTTTHCTDDFEDPFQHADDIEDHHHDHEAGEGAGHCISVEYYILSYAGKSVKRIVDYPTPEFAHFLFANMLSCEEKTEAIAPDYKLKFIPLENTFTAFVKGELPLRGPPSNLA